MSSTELKGLIGISGFQKSGKDTSADYLVEYHGYQKLSLALPIKEVCRELFGFSEEDLYGTSERRSTLYPDYLFSGKDPVDGSDLTLIEESDDRWWIRESDKEAFPRFITPRLALTSLGTDWGRRLCVDLWAEKLLGTLVGSSHQKWVISDVRFLNEMSLIQRRGGRVIRLLRGKLTTSHPSETELASVPLEDFDAVVDNRGTKEHLYTCLDNIVK